MFKGQPKGLYALSLANTGERFGYYTMLAIFTLFLQAKFGYTEAVTTQIYGIFLAAVYFMPFFGGILADRFGFGRMVTLGIIVMFGGYALLSIPTGTGFAAQALMFLALTLIACGTGLFKGNLQVMVGNLYDDPAYSAKRDSAFSIFYMAINIGAMFAPSMATWITNHFLAQDGLTYNGQIPALAHQYLAEGASMPAEPLAELQRLAVSVGGDVSDLGSFASHYIEKLSSAYNMGFAVACVSLDRLLCDLRRLPQDLQACRRHGQAAGRFGSRRTGRADARADQVAHHGPHARLRRGDLLLDGLPPERLDDDLLRPRLHDPRGHGLHAHVLRHLQPPAGSGRRLRSGRHVPGREGPRQAHRRHAPSSRLVVALYYRYTVTPDPVHILPQVFQQFNPFYVVALTPLSVALFASLARKGKEPSAPRKIGMGMIIAALGFLILTDRLVRA